MRAGRPEVNARRDTLLVEMAKSQEMTASMVGAYLMTMAEKEDDIDGMQAAATIMEQSHVLKKTITAFLESVRS